MQLAGKSSIFAERTGPKLELITSKGGSGDGEVRISGNDDESIMSLRLKVIDLTNSEASGADAAGRKK
jgi:hypothetical protein